MRSILSIIILAAFTTPMLGQNLGNLAVTGNATVGGEQDNFATINVINQLAEISYDMNTAIADYQRKYKHSTARFIIYGYPNSDIFLPHVRESVMLYATGDAKSLILTATQPEGTIKFFTQTWENPANERMRIDNQGYIGIGTTNPKSKLQVSDGDIYIDNISSGVIMKSPNGTCWRMQVDNSGTPVFTSITCP